MSTTVVLGNTSYIIPTAGSNPVDGFWGDNVTQWIKDASTRINAVVQLLPETTVTILVNQTNTTITQLSFSPLSYRRVEVTFGINRDGDYETGKLILISDGTNWDFTLEYDGAPPTDVVLGLSGNNVVYSTPNTGANGTMKVTAEGIST